jgi:hypothetical protein
MQFLLCFQHFPACLSSILTFHAMPHRSLHAVMEKLVEYSITSEMPFFLVTQLVSALQLCSVNTIDERRLTMSSLMFIMLISLLPFPMQAVTLAAEWVTKRARQACR